MISDQALTDIPKIGDSIKIQKISLTANSNVPVGQSYFGILSSLAIGCHIEVKGDKNHYNGEYAGKTILTSTSVIKLSINEDGSINAETRTSTYRLELENSKYQAIKQQSTNNFGKEIARAITRGLNNF